jgi:hypothetical protein
MNDPAGSTTNSGQSLHSVKRSFGCNARSRSGDSGPLLGAADVTSGAASQTEPTRTRPSTHAVTSARLDGCRGLRDSVLWPIAPMVPANTIDPNFLIFPSVCLLVVTLRSRDRGKRLPRRYRNADLVWSKNWNGRKNL